MRRPLKNCYSLRFLPRNCWTCLRKKSSIINLNWNFLIILIGCAVLPKTFETAGYAFAKKYLTRLTIYTNQMLFNYSNRLIRYSGQIIGFKNTHTPPHTSIFSMARIFINLWNIKICIHFSYRFFMRYLYMLYQFGSSYSLYVIVFLIES